jgi:F420-dependent oxidoreductase-like protein
MGSSHGRPGPTDAWLTLAALGRETQGIRLGTLVTSATFRLPGVLAVAVAQADDMSGGRIELGLGTGWFEAEHRANGVPFPPLAERFERLEEQLEVITGLWATPEGATFSHHGRHYDLADSPALPKPRQRPRPPIILGGTGATRTPRLTARFADEYNSPFTSPDDTRRNFERVRKACEDAGRDPATLRLSHAIVVCCGADETQVKQRAAGIGRDVAELREHGAAGTPAEVVERLAVYRDMGAQRSFLQLLDLHDLDHLALIAEEVLPLVE